MCSELKSARATEIVGFGLLGCDAMKSRSAPEDGTDTFLRKVRNHVQDYTLSQPTRQRTAFITSIIVYLIVHFSFLYIQISGFLVRALTLIEVIL
jgi:hypothetical protein